jgi:hypothetical protein
MSARPRVRRAGDKRFQGFAAPWSGKKDVAVTDELESFHVDGIKKPGNALHNALPAGEQAAPNRNSI